VTVFDILVELNVAAIIVITRAVLPGVIPTAILSPLAVEYRILRIFFYLFVIHGYQIPSCGQQGQKYAKW
jgi:hypothetical protein